jgi:hypothetical protein
MELWGYASLRPDVPELARARGGKARSCRCSASAGVRIVPANAIIALHSLTLPSLLFILQVKRVTSSSRKLSIILRAAIVYLRISKK